MSAEHFETRAIHDGTVIDAGTGALVQPVYLNSTYQQSRIGEHVAGFEYSRLNNPNRQTLEQQLASLEHATFAIAFSSGMAAEDAALRAVLNPGDHVIISDDVYGGSYRLLETVYRKWGVDFTVVDQTNIDNIVQAFTDKTRLVRIETPSNPLLKIVDIAAVAQLAKSHGALTLVDNTYASPLFQQPLTLGADIVVHSTTKFINGHSDVIGGTVLLNDAALAEEVKFIQTTVGSGLSAHDAWLTTRGLKTLPVRMRQHGENALELAKRLSEHPKIERVFYPGLESHPGHELAKTQMTGFGGMLSVTLTGGASQARALIEGTQLFTLASSFGGVESLISYPSVMTHAALVGTVLEVPTNLARISVGLEHVDDLWRDLEETLDTI